jgi:hypothetical protein
VRKAHFLVLLISRTTSHKRVLIRSYHGRSHTAYFWHLDTHKVRLIIFKIISFLVFPGPFHSRFIGKLLEDVTSSSNTGYPTRMLNNRRDFLWYQVTITLRSKSLTLMSCHSLRGLSQIGLPITKPLVTYLLHEIVALSCLYLEYDLLLCQTHRGTSWELVKVTRSKSKESFVTNAR